ncbi:ATP-binding protein [Nocardia alni]|uniref:ATP-binding protein n=1 Tax=Nocardia alni TaxID=2815723 RepID=UPI001C23060E|nr:LuxR C-terminal-related transcriptional regulator [Nocardia alni]
MTTREVVTDGFIGRHAELDRIHSLLRAGARLVTLVGEGGIGKTRLASEALGRYHRAFRVPTYWVRLARLNRAADAVTVEEEIARSAIAADFSGRSARAALIDMLTRVDASGRPAQTVLVMDNCEHVVAGVGQQVGELLEAVPGLTILATSRQPLGWVDEYRVAVPPLSGPQALTLFRQRAELSGHVVIDPAGVSTATEICRHVHNHPLYVRLAAARLAHRPLAMILTDLSGKSETDKRMSWPGPARGVEPRHRRLRDVVDWSYQLCTDKERLLFERLSVFAPGDDTSAGDGGPVSQTGADLEAIRDICSDDPDSAGVAGIRLALDEIEYLLDRLVEQSLVTCDITSTTVRYSLVETLRLFARERLAERSSARLDEPARLAESHQRYYRDTVVRAHAEWLGSEEQRWLDWARAAWPNILAALRWSLSAQGQSRAALEIVVGLMALRLPFFAGSLREMRQWVERAVSADRAAAEPAMCLQVAALALDAWIALCQGCHAEAEPMLERCVERIHPDPETRRDWRRHPEIDIGLPAPFEFAWGTELMLVRRDPVAIAVLDRAREKSALLGDHGAAAMCEMFQALAAAFLGSTEQALNITRSNLAHAEASRAQWLISWGELALAIALLKHGDPHEALAVGRSALEYQLPVNDQWGATWAVHIRTWSLARVIADSPGERRELLAVATEAAHLAGGAATLRVRLGVNIDELGPFADEMRYATGVVRGVLGEAGFDKAALAGSLLRPERFEAQRLAAGIISMTEIPQAHPAGASLAWGTLTRAEREVAVLAAAGWPTTSIAARRGISPRTVETQLAAVFRKLSINSRDRIAEFVPADRVDGVVRERSRRPRRHRTPSG